MTTKEGTSLSLDSADLVNSLFALIPIPVAIADESGKVVLANSCFHEVFPSVQNIDKSMLSEVIATDQGAFDIEILPLNEAGMKIVYGIDVTKELILRRQLTLFERREKRSLKSAPQRLRLDLNEIVMSVASTLRPHLNNLRISLSVVAAEELPRVVGDREHIEKVVFTLVVGAERSIAVSERRSGSIEIKTFVENGLVCVSVVDNGSGIHMGDIGIAAEPPAGGSLMVYRPISLGLCAEIVKDHNGELFSWCSYGGGSTYMMELPAWDPLDSDLDVKGTQAELQFLRGRNILVIDDEVHVTELIFDVLTRHGANLDVANSSDEALKKVGRKRYDLIICDQNMPGLDDDAFNKLFEPLDAESPHRVLFVTGSSVSAGTRRLLMHAGVEFIRRPLHMDDLVSTIEMLLTRNPLQGS